MAENKGTPHVDKGTKANVLNIAGQSQLPEEFIKIGKEFDDALGKAVLRDEEQRNSLVLTKAWLLRHGLIEEVEILTNWLASGPAIGGFNRSLAAMAYTGIYTPEGAGLKTSKESQKAMQELRQEKQKAKED